MPRFAANLSMMFTERPFLDRFAAAADAGFDAVEFLFPYDHPDAVVAARARQAEVEVVLFNMPPGDWGAGDRGMAALPGRSAEFRAGVERSLNYAQSLGTGRIHAMAGLASPADPGAAAAYRDAIAFACDCAAEVGVEVMIEPINGRDMPGYFLRDFSLAAGMIEELERPNLKLQFDVYHRQILQGDVVTGLEALLPVIGHVQIASVPRRSEPGAGELDDAFLFAALDRLSYRGLVGCEYRPSGVTEDGLGWFEQYRVRSGASTRAR